MLSMINTTAYMQKPADAPAEGKISVSNGMKPVPIGLAREKIKNGIRAYLQKEENGDYLIPRQNRIPYYLYGNPGIGKTAISKDIAEELGIGFVSFSLTHHTRNSLLGLPVISELSNARYTEYTMSEVIAAVVREVQKGHEEGILLLDEFNCASDTIMPSMLAFLQTGSIGMHSLPDGWVLILCGNPPEYNKSARLFDAAVLDRLRMLRVDAEHVDFAVYAKAAALHPVICEFLSQNEEMLYHIASRKNDLTVQNMKKSDCDLEVVTPRSWENLSWALKSYERMGLEIDEAMIAEYLKSEKTSYSFYQYYWMNAQNFSVKDAEAVLKRENFSGYAKEISGKNLAFRWKVVELLGQGLIAEAKESQDVVTISEEISNAFRFLDMLPDKDKLSEKLFLKINESNELLGILMQVRNEDYLKICSRAYGINAEKTST